METASVYPASFVESWIPGHDKHMFYTRTYAASSPKAVLVFVHGFQDHISRYEDIHLQFSKHGVTVFAYDMRGFGRTTLDIEHRSRDTFYGKTRRSWELEDLAWWVKRLNTEYHGLPLFLMGYSAGGGLTLSFATRTEGPPSPEIVLMLSGIIATSPLLRMTHPLSKMVKFAANVIRTVAPFMVIPTSAPEEHFSKIPEVHQALRDDPWRRPEGTLQGVKDMLTQGEELLDSNWTNWPLNLPLLIAHGTKDEVTSCPAVVDFYSKLNISDKKLSLYEDALHDLMHESDGIPGRLIDECLSWIEAHLSLHKS